MTFSICDLNLSVIHEDILVMEYGKCMFSSLVTDIGGSCINLEGQNTIHVPIKVVRYHLAFFWTYLQSTVM